METLLLALLALFTAGYAQAADAIPLNADVCLVSVGKAMAAYSCDGSAKAALDPIGLDVGAEITGQLLKFTQTGLKIVSCVSEQTSYTCLLGR